MKRDIGQSIRILGLFIFIAMAAVAAAALPASRIFSNNTPDAVAVAPVLIAYLCSLLPMAVLFIVQRTFYAYADARTPFLFTMIQAVIIVVLTLLVSYTVPVEQLTAAVALAQSLAGIVQVIVATMLLRRKLGPLELGPTWRALCRFALMAIPAGGAGVSAVLPSRRDIRLDDAGQDLGGGGCVRDRCGLCARLFTPARALPRAGTPDRTGAAAPDEALTPRSGHG